MKNKKGNVMVIAIIIVIVAITAGVLGWLFAAKSQAPSAQTISQSTTPQTPTQPAVQVAEPATQSAPSATQSAPSATQSAPSAVENKESNWKLISGNSDDTCTGPVYEGSATVKGWYILDTGYAGKEWMLEISDNDINKLPAPKAISNYSNFNQKLKLVDASPELQKELKSATKDNPKEITLRGYYLYCEGSPVVSVAPATESFKQYIRK